MEKILVAVDGSAPSQRAVEFVIARATPAVQIHLDRIDETELAERIEEAWLVQAPKRLAAEYLAGRD